MVMDNSILEFPCADALSGSRPVTGLLMAVFINFLVLAGCLVIGDGNLEKAYGLTFIVAPGSPVCAYADLGRKMRELEAVLRLITVLTAGAGARMPAA